MTTEHLEQVAYFQWVDIMKKTDLRYSMIYAIPNGGHRHKIVAAKMKREGVRAGVLDINIDVPIGVYHGMRIEAKLDETKKLSSLQKKWMANYRKFGFAAERCNGFEEMKAMTEMYLAGEYPPF